MDVKRIMDALCELSKGYISHRVKYDECRDEEYVPDFIMQVNWACNREHIFSKFRHYRDKYGMGWAMPFYNELDTTNAPEFCEWLEEYATILRIVRVLKKHGKVYVNQDERKHFLTYCEAIGLNVCGGIVDEDGDQLFYIEK